MTNLLQLQQRLVEVGRIRLGEKRTSQSSGKEYPAKLEQWRLTSRDKPLLDHAAGIYGGQVKKWGDQWELLTDSDVLDVAVVPGQAISQSYELWGQKTTRSGKKSAVICLRRCDGSFETKTEGPCLCAQEDQQACKPTTRLSVVLTKVPGLGVWRVETHGWNAAAELAGSVQLLEALVATKRPVRARLRLDQREQATEEGTRKFAVPVISIDHTLEQILDTIGAGEAGPALEQGAAALPAPSGMTPVPVDELPEGPRPSIADQVGGVSAAKPGSRRVNAAEPFKATGIAPRTAQQADENAAGAPANAPAREEAGDAPKDATPDTPGPPSGQSAPASAPSDAPTLVVDTEGAQSVARWCREAGLTTDEERHAFLLAYSKGAYSSSKAVPVDELQAIRQTLIRIYREELRLEWGKGDPRLINATLGLETTDPAGEHRAAGSPAPASGWKAIVGEVPGIGEAKFIAAAKKIANRVLGAEAANAITGFEDVPDGIAKDLREWLDEKRQAA